MTDLTPEWIKHLRRYAGHRDTPAGAAFWELCDEVDRLRTERDEARAALDRVRALCDGARGFPTFGGGTAPPFVDVDDLRRALNGHTEAAP